MNVSGFHNDVLQLAVEEHEILSQYTKSVSRLFGTEPAASRKQAVQAIARLADKKILNHFAYEETNVFTPLLATRPGRKTVQLVATFQAEHKLLLRQIHQLERTLALHRLPGDAAAVWKAVMRFFDNFEDHASKEDELFHSLLDGHPVRRPVRRARPTRRPANSRRG